MRLNKTKCNKYLLSYVISTIVLLLSQANISIAATDRANMNVTVNAVDACIINSPDSINFGYISSSDSFPILANFNIEVTCTNNTTYSITHNGGTYTDSSSEGRLINGASYMRYFFKNANGASNWSAGSALDGTNTGTGLLVLHSARFCINYASDLDNVTLPGEAHTDTVIFTVNF